MFGELSVYKLPLSLCDRLPESAGMLIIANSLLNCNNNLKIIIPVKIRYCKKNIVQVLTELINWTDKFYEYLKCAFLLALNPIYEIIVTS